MSEKRYDNKRRVLRSGESQRGDGRYAYKYTDKTGKVKFIYAWKLVPTDRTPSGKRDGPSLREKEKEIQKDVDDGIDTAGRKLTVCQLYEKHNYLHGNVRPDTEISREWTMKLLQADKLGSMSIASVKLSDAKAWALRMKERGIAYQSISHDKRALKAIFYDAIQDDYVRKNPFDFQLSSVIENDTVKKTPLTPEQVNQLLEFVQKDTVYRKYYDEIVILLGTGLRISELCGLTESSLDFENRIILVDHQLLRSEENGYYIETPKTESGIRRIPMNNKVYEAFRRVQKRTRPSSVFVLDGYTMFLFYKRNGEPRSSSDYRAMMTNLVKKYNKHSGNKLEKLSPHLLRHTFCTNMANSGMNPKALQYIMGHASINMTLNYYAHPTLDSAKAEMERISA